MTSCAPQRGFGVDPQKPAQKSQTPFKYDVIKILTPSKTKFPEWKYNVFRINFIVILFNVTLHSDVEGESKYTKRRCKAEINFIICFEMFRD